jgi:hypothetical protein
MQSILLALTLISVIGCSSTPKGEYSKSKIERPYALPDDIATTEFGYNFETLSSSNVDGETASSDADEQSYSIPYFAFEQGIAENVSWIYPIGIRWGILKNDKHTAGISVASVIFVTTTSLDYWYRISEKFSIRPFFRTLKIDIFILEEDRQGPGLELVYQATEALAISLTADQGTYSGGSDLVDAIFDDISGSDDSDSSVDGTYSGFSVAAQYALNDKWDLNISVGSVKTQTDDFTIGSSNGKLGFKYIY